MNHVYRTVWNEITGTLVAVAENVRSRGRRGGGGRSAAAPTEADDAGPRGLVQAPPRLLRLEPRLVFDGAAVATAADAVVYDAVDATTGTAIDTAAHAVAPVDAVAQPRQAGAERSVLGAVATGGEATSARREVAFIDTAVGGYEQLVASVRPGVEVVLIDSRTDALAQLADWAATHRDYDAIHLLSHGAEGTLFLGRGQLDQGSLDDARVSAELQQLGQALSADGDLLLYGCAVASGEAGQAFIARLAEATGADVAASTDATGSTDRGGDWSLEARAGEVKAEALRLDGFDGALAVPTNGTTNFEAPDFFSNGGTGSVAGAGGYTVANIGSSGWDLTGYSSNNAADVVINLETDYQAPPSQFVYAASLGGATSITAVQLAPNTPKLFDLGSVDVLLDTGAPGSVSVTLVGYRNGSAVGGATLTQSVTTLNGGGGHAVFNVSGDSDFVGIDAFRVTTSDPAVTLLGVDNVTATNFRDAAVAPTVTAVTSSTANGTYKIGDTISVQVGFSAAVNVTGTPQLTLETGSTDRVINYSSGSGTSTLTFSYTIQAGDTSGDLDYVSTAALSLNSGTIKDAASGTDATLTLASPGAANSLGAGKNLVVDGVAPSAPSAPDLDLGSDSGASSSDNITSTTTPTFTGTAEAGSTVTLYDTDGVTVLGTGTATGGNWSITSSTLSEGAHQISARATDAAGNASAASSGLSVQIDTTAPTTTVSSIALSADTGTSSTDFVTRTAAQTISGTLSANLAAGESVQVSLDNGATWTTATATVGQSTWSLAGQTLTGSETLKVCVVDAAGLSGAVASQAYTVDTTGATVTSVSSTTAAGTYKAGDTIAVQVAFSEAVTVDTGGGTPTLRLETGSTDRDATYLSGSGTSTLTFQYTVQAGDTAADLDQQSTSALALNGGTITDVAGNNAVLTLASPGAANSLGANEALVIDTTAPVFQSATTEVTGTRITLTYDSALSASTVAANRFAVTAAGSGVGVQSATVSGSTVVLSLYGQVRYGQAVTVAYTDLTAGDDTGVVQDAVGNDAVSFTATSVTNTARPNVVFDNGFQLFLNGAANGFAANTTNPDIDRDTASAVVNGFAITSARFVASAGSTSASGTFQTQGNDVVGTLTFTGNLVNASGTSVGTATYVLDGAISKHNKNANGDLGDTEAFFFFSDGNADTSRNGLGFLLITRGDEAYFSGTDQNLSLPADSGYVTTLNAYLATQSDATPPTVAIGLSDSALTTGETSTVTFTFSEAVTGFTNADITVPNGTLGTVSSSDGGTTWTATYTPNAGVSDNSNVITVDMTGVTDAALNAGVGSTDSANFTIDTARPTVGVVVSDTALTAGETSLVTFTFSEAVTGFTNADLTVPNGTLSNVSSADGGTTWTATYTPTAGISDATNVITVAMTGVADASGNAGTGTTDSNNFAIDTRRPTATIAMSDSALKIGDTATVTFTFSEAVTGFSNADLTVASGTLSNVSTADGGVTWTATFTPSASTTDTTNLITLDNTGVVNAVGNAGSGTTSSANYVVDTEAPTLSSVSLSDTNLKVGDTAIVTFTFSEAVTGFTAADVTVANGSLSGLSTADGGITWTAIFTPTASVEAATNVLTVDLTGVADAVGNAGTGTSDSGNYRVDTVRPTATITMADSALRLGETSQVTFTFSEAVVGFTNADLTIANGSLSSVSSSDGGITWRATFTPASNVEDTSNVITLNNAGVIDLSGNTGSGTTDTANYTIDTRRPTVTISLDDTSLKIGDTATVTFTFSEAVTGFSAADLLVDNGTVSNLGTSDGGVTWTATFTPDASVESATNVITVDNTGLADIAGNAGSGSTDSAVYAVDTVRPTATITLSDSALKIGDTATVTFTFSEAVTGFTSGDVTVANGTLGSLSSADGGVTWTGTFTPTASVEDATNLLTLANSGVTDAAGNAGTGTTDSANYAVDTVRPTATITLSDSALKIGDTATVTFTFSEAVTGFTSGDVTVANGTLGSLSSADGGLTWTGTFTPASNIEDASNVITLANSGVTDLAGNAGTGSTATANYTVDTLRPTVTINLDDANLKIGDTATVTFTFSEAVTGFTTADLLVDNGTVSNLGSADGGLTWTATFTPAADTESAANVIRLHKTGVTDLAGNAGTGSTDSANYAIDTHRPIATITVSDTALKAGDTATVTFTFSEAVSGFSNADLTVVNGSLGPVSSSDGGVTWQATFTPTANFEDPTNLIRLDKTGVSDAAGNAGSGSTDSVNIAIDTLPPSALTLSTTDVMASATGTNAAIGTLSAVESSAVTWSFATGDGTNDAGNAFFNLSGNTLRSNATLAGGTYLLFVRATDAAGNPSTQALSLTVTANTAPTVDTPAVARFTDTIDPDSFSAVTGNFTASDTEGDTIAAWGVTGGTTGGATTIGGVTYDLSKAGDGVTLYVNSSDGRYAVVGNGSALNAMTAASSQSFTITALDSNAAAMSGSATLTVEIAATNDRPLNTVLPVLAGNARVGETISGDLGAFTDAESTPLTTSRFWQVADDAGGLNARTIDGQTAGTLTLGAGQAHRWVREVVTASDGGLSASGASAWTLVANTAPAFAGGAPVTVETYGDTAAADAPAAWTGTVTATDIDSDTLAYGLTGGSTGGAFSAGGVTYDVAKVGSFGTLYLASTTGQLRYLPSAAALDALVGAAQDDFTLTTDDGHGGSASRTVRIALTGANDAPTLATPTAGQVTDTPANDRFVATTGTLVGADRDTGAVLTYGIQGGTVAAGVATLAGTHGTLTVDTATGAYAYTPDATAVNGLTTDTTDSFTVTVGDGQATTSAVYTVRLTAANDTPSLATPAPVDYTDTAASDRFTPATGTLAGADRDRGAVLSYGVQGGTAQGGVVTLVGTYGTLAVQTATGAYTYTPDATAINRLTGPASEQFTVTASDGQAGASATLQVRIAGANDQPRVTSPGTASVDENVPAGTVVYRATVSDVDTGQRHGYRLEGPDAERFTIDAATGEVRLVGSPDAEAQASYRFTVVATDDGAPALSDRRDVVLTVNDLNEAPTIAPLTEATLSETAAAGTVVARVRGADVDAGTTLRYSLVDVPRNAAGEPLFEIDAATGDVRLTAAGAAAIDADGPTTGYSFGVQVSDGQLSSPVGRIAIGLANENDNPPVLTVDQPTVTLAEDAAAGPIAGAVARASDADGDALRFSLDNPPVDAAGRPLFAIDPVTGQVSLTAAGAAAVDFEAGPRRYELQVRVSDGTPSHDQTRALAIVLGNANDNAPVLSLRASSVTIPEDMAAGDIPGAQALATDADGDAPQFSLIDVPRNAAGEPLFAIDPATGQVRLTAAGAAALDYDGGLRAYTLRVQVTDGVTGHAREASLTIGVSDVVEPTAAPAPVESAPAPAPSPAPAPAPAVVGFAAEAPRQEGLTSVPPPPLRTTDGFPVPVADPGAVSLGAGLRTQRDIPDQIVAVRGEPMRLAVPADTFVHTDPNAQVTLSAARVDGQPMPPWLVFDANRGEFSGQPPEGFSGEFLVRVIARDQFGREAEATVRIVIRSAGERSSANETGRPALSAKFVREGSLAWKAERERLLGHARAATGRLATRG